MPRQDKIVSLQAPTPGSTITIPHLFTPRSYQARPMAFIDGGGKRAATVWHRRAGKDLAWLNQVIKQMVSLPFCATFLYIFPKLTQGRRDLWDAKSSPNSGGIPFRAHFPPALVMETSETEMQIILKPMPYQKPQEIATGHGKTKMVGSVFQVMGTDKDSIENIRGINSYGNVFSEYQDQNPDAWTRIIQPVVLENGGWAAFNYTPKGKNHGYELFEMARRTPGWFCERLTIDDTRRDAPGENGLPVVTAEQIAQLRAEGVPEEIIQQEYFSSFEGMLRGTIYGDLLQYARRDGRITRVPAITSFPVGTMWDLGRDTTAIWFYQVQGSEIRFIDYYANRGLGTDHYAKILHEKPYTYAKVLLPHDGAHHRGQTPAETVEEFLRRMLCKNVQVGPKMDRQASIDMVRRMFSRFVFDEQKCSALQGDEKKLPSGLDCLGNYRREWHELKKDYSGEPVHDANSHGADALRNGIMLWEEGLDFGMLAATPLTVISDFDPRAMFTQKGRHDGLTVH